METKKSVILRTDREKLSNLKTKEKNGGGGAHEQHIRDRVTTARA